MGKGDLIHEFDQTRPLGDDTVNVPSHRKSGGRDSVLGLIRTPSSSQVRHRRRRPETTQNLASTHARRRSARRSA